MLREIGLKDALKKYLDGREVRVMHEAASGNGEAVCRVDTLEEALGETARYLVDIPAAKCREPEGAVAKAVPAGKKIDEALAAKMLAEGRSQREVAQEMGVAQSTVSAWARAHKQGAGKKCATCMYREVLKGRGNCNYLGATGHSRGCAAEGCTKYEQGDPKPCKVRPTL